jgi:hypothetical protein
VNAKIDEERDQEARLIRAYREIMTERLGVEMDNKKIKVMNEVAAGKIQCEMESLKK